MGKTVLFKRRKPTASEGVTPLPGLYPTLPPSDISVAVHRKGLDQLLCKFLSENASLEAQGVFGREVVLWKYLVSCGLAETVTLDGSLLTQPFNRAQLTQISPYYLRKNRRSLFFGIIEQLTRFEDARVLLEYFSISSFAASEITGMGNVSVVDISSAVSGQDIGAGSVQAALLSLAYCLLELFTLRERLDLPAELSLQVIKEYRSQFPPEVYRYLQSLIAPGVYKTVHDAFDALLGVSWSLPQKEPWWPRLIPGKRVGLCSCAVAAFLFGGVLARALRKPDLITAGNSVPAVEVDNTLLIRNKIFVEKSCVGCDLSGWNFIEVDLSGVNLSEANLTGARIIRSDVLGINLSGATLDNAKLEFLTFKDATLSGASLQNTYFYKVALVDTDMSYTDLSAMNQWSQDEEPSEGEYSLRFQSVNFNYAVLDNMSWRSIKGDADADADKALSIYNNVHSFRYASMKGFSLEEGNVSEVDFTGADLSGANFRYTHFDKAILDGVTATDADFYRAFLTDVVARDADFDRAHLDGAWVRGSVFDGSTMRDASLRGMKGAQSMSLVNTDMRGVDTFWTSFD